MRVGGGWEDLIEYVERHFKHLVQEDPSIVDSATAAARSHGDGMMDIGGTSVLVRNVQSTKTERREK